MQETDCGQCREMLFDYVSGLTDDEESRAVAAHIESCPECRRELEFIKSMLAAAADIPEVPVPEDVREAVASRLSEAETEIKRNRSKKLRRIVSAAVPVAAAVALTIGMYAGGVFDKFRSADEIMDGKPVPVEDSGAADNKTAEPHMDNQNDGGNTSGINSDNAVKQPAERQGTESGTAESRGNSETAASRKGSISGTDKTDKTENMTSGNRESRAAENSDSRVKAEDVQGERPKQENDTSGGGAETSAEDSKDTEEPQASVYGAPRADVYDGSLGGGSARIENDEAAAAHEPRLMSGAYASVPKSCEIVSGDAEAYAEKFGAELAEGGCSFAISTEEWESLRSFAENNGDSVNTGEFVSADSIDTISVTVTER